MKLIICGSLFTLKGLAQRKSRRAILWSYKTPHTNSIRTLEDRSKNPTLVRNYKTKTIKKVYHSSNYD